MSFLDLIVDNGYSVTTYFEYSLLNAFGIITKFIPLSFLVAITIFILRQIQENEFIILWTSRVKKIQIVNLFLLVSIVITIFHLFFSVILAPTALNKSRYLLSIIRTFPRNITLQWISIQTLNLQATHSSTSLIYKHLSQYHLNIISY